MGIFDKFKGSKTKNEPNKNTEENTTSQAFSGWRLETPNYSNLPIINNVYLRDGMIPFGYTGSDMYFPSLIEQSIYEAAPSHHTCIKLAVKSAIGAGYEFSGYDKYTLDDKLKYTTFEKTLRLNKFLKEITKDFRLHNRINLFVTKHTNGKLSFERINPAKIGYNKSKTKFYYSEDFISGVATSVYDRYENGCAPGKYILEFDGTTDKYAPYPAPEWISGFPYIKLNSKIPTFHEGNMENSINVNLVIKKPSLFKDNAERLAWFKELFSRRGADKTGSTLVFSAPSKEQLPEVEQLQANDNGDLFKELRESTINDICMSHGINPILIGISIAGSLGANQEAQFQYEQFYKTEVVDIIEHIEYVINELLTMSNLNGTFTLIENKIFTNVNNSNQGFEITVKK